MLRSEKTSITKKMNFRTSVQKIKTKRQTKYLGIIIDKRLSFQIHTRSVKQITRATGLLVKRRPYLPVRMLKKSVYSSLFDSYSKYSCCQTWGQNCNSHTRHLEKIKKKKKNQSTYLNLRENLQI